MHGKCSSNCGRSYANLNLAQQREWDAEPLPGHCGPCSRAFRGAVTPVPRGVAHCPSCSRGMGAKDIGVCKKCAAAGLSVEPLF